MGHCFKIVHERLLLNTHFNINFFLHYVNDEGIKTGLIPSTLTFPVNIILSLLDTHLHPHVALNKGQTGEDWDQLKGNSLSERGKYWI